MEFIKFFGSLISLGFSSVDALHLEQLAIQTAEQRFQRDGEPSSEPSYIEGRIFTARERLLGEIVREIEKGSTVESLSELLLKNHRYF